MAELRDDLIRDDDLRTKLDELRNGGAFAIDVQVRHLINIQERRDREREAVEKRQHELALLPREQRRRAEIREELATIPPGVGDLRHIHSVLAVCGMPYDRPPADVRTFEKRQGNMSLLVTAGQLASPGHDTDWVAQPLPFGPKARLIMMYLCSEAIKQKSPTIEIADSLSGFIKDMGFSVTGGKKGTLTAFKEQLNALAACEMKIGVWDGEGQTARTRRLTPFDAIDVWLPTTPDMKMLWPTTVTFNEAFFKSLDRHALPVNKNAVKAFAGSARKLDLYFWIGSRLYSLNGRSEPLRLSWDALTEQFGGGFSRPRAFRAHLAEDLKHIKEVLPKIPFKLTENGLLLESADPELVLALPTRRVSKKT